MTYELQSTPHCSLVDDIMYLDEEHFTIMTYCGGRRVGLLTANIPCTLHDHKLRSYTQQTRAYDRQTLWWHQTTDNIVYVNDTLVLTTVETLEYTR